MSGGKTIKIGDREVGPGCPVYLIAEIGINHNGDLQIAKKLMDAAFACGWDCVKFQKRVPEICVPEDQKSVIRETPWGTMTYLEYKKRIEFGKEEYDYIDRYCSEKPIQWTASAWDMPSLEFILEYDVPFVKIPSAMLTNDDLVKAVADTGKPVLLSTGMSSMEEIDHAVEILNRGASGGYILMHCNSAYPAPREELNLRMIETLKDRYGCLVGYSGHEFDLEPSVTAALLGAVVIERHVTLDHDMWGTDQAASLQPHGMFFLGRRITSALETLGDGCKRVIGEELSVRKKLRSV